MKVIIANINGIDELIDFEVSKINEFCLGLGIASPVLVHTIERLTKTLEENMSENFILFSNFPPDKSYESKRKADGYLEYDDQVDEYWQSYSYSKSKMHFKNLLTNYDFKAVHFITAAPEERVSNILLKSLFPIMPISVIRKETWRSGALSFAHYYTIYITEKIQEAVS